MCLLVHLYTSLSAYLRGPKVALNRKQPTTLIFLTFPRNLYTRKLYLQVLNPDKHNTLLFHKCINTPLQVLVVKPTYNPKYCVQRNSYNNNII